MDRYCGIDLIISSSSEKPKKYQMLMCLRCTKRAKSTFWVICGTLPITYSNLFRIIKPLSNGRAESKKPVAKSKKTVAKSPNDFLPVLRLWISPILKPNRLFFGSDIPFGTVLGRERSPKPWTKPVLSYLNCFPQRFCIFGWFRKQNNYTLTFWPAIFCQHVLLFQII